MGCLVTALSTIHFLPAFGWSFAAAEDFAATSLEKCLTHTDMAKFVCAEYFVTSSLEKCLTHRNCKVQHGQGCSCGLHGLPRDQKQTNGLQFANGAAAEVNLWCSIQNAQWSSTLVPCGFYILQILVVK